MNTQPAASSKNGDLDPRALPEHDSAAYTARLEAERAWWKRLLNTQAPYRWNIRRVVRGRVLDVGCGVGRNLLHLDGKGIGVDTNTYSVAVARSKGLNVFTATEFLATAPEVSVGFDTLLFAHVLEHMSADEASNLVTSYLPCLRPGGRLVIIVPQEAGFESDATHVEFVTNRFLLRIAAENALKLDGISSFPLPRVMGRLLRYNETVAVFEKASV